MDKWGAGLTIGPKGRSVCAKQLGAILKPVLCYVWGGLIVENPATALLGKAILSMSWPQFFYKKKAGRRPLFLRMIERARACVSKIESLCYLRDEQNLLLLCKIRAKVTGKGRRGWVGLKIGPRGGVGERWVGVNCATAKK